MSAKIDHASAADPILVRAAQRGDLLAFEELVARHRDKVYSRAFSILRHEEDAVDMSQDAWIKAWQRLKQFQHEASFTTWITRIVINLCLDHLRKQKRYQTQSIEVMEAEGGGVEKQLPVEIPNPTERLERSELRQRIDQALAQMSLEHRTALTLLEYEQLEYKEIAKRMNCSIGTVMSRIFYARRRLASLLAGLKREDYQ